MRALILALTVGALLLDAERSFVAWRDADDAARLAPGPRAERRRADRAAAVRERLRLVDRSALTEADRRAFDAMQRAVRAEDEEDAGPVEAVYEAFRAAGASIPFEGETLDRLSILERLGTEADADRRRRLFLSLEPVWTSVAGPPYASLVEARRAAWAATDDGTPFDLRARAWGLTPEGLERTLVGILEAWRDHLAQDAAVEPWDWWYVQGAAGRALAPTLTLDATIGTAVRYFRDLGADPKTLRVRLDLEPRRGKDPVAYTDFLKHGRYRRGTWEPGRFVVSSTYRSGGLGILYELMHELGHAAHIAAIRTRPAFNDWPDSDVLTEALADMLGVEAYEGAGADGARRERLAGTVMDVVWALFEIRVHRDGAEDPNLVWTEITREYLRIKPHPELAWWAMRGQLVDSPGYMSNYALGAVLTEALRARVLELRGPDAFRNPTPELYLWLVERLYRFGLERPSREVVEEFLGGPVDPGALAAAIAAAP
jgi:hypothetical protein